MVDRLELENVLLRELERRLRAAQETLDAAVRELGARIDRLEQSAATTP